MVLHFILVRIRIIFLFIFLFQFNFKSGAQEFILQGWYWDYPKLENGNRWAETIEQQAELIIETGFTYVWLPPMSRSGSGSLSIGYDVSDYYDLGEIYGGGPTRFGKREHVDSLITTFNSHGINAIADMVYNHRSGGEKEDNPAVEGWIENMTWQKVEDGDNPFPSDRYSCYLPIGGATGNDPGTYYLKIKSASAHSRFHNKPYTVLMWTNAHYINSSLVEWMESEPNGGGDCGETNNTIELGREMLASVDNSGCGVDEFQIEILSGDIEAGGDTLWITLVNTDAENLGDYSDHFVFGIWNGSADVQSQLKYETGTGFGNVPSGQGTMNWENFKPNGSPTQLNGDWDSMFWFYDLEHASQSTQSELFAWTNWMYTDIGTHGFRVDAVKQFPPSFVGDLLDSLHNSGIDPGIFVGEFFDGNPWTLKQWIDDVSANMNPATLASIQPKLFDFTLRYELERACDLFGHDVRNVFDESMADAAGVSGFNVVTFVDNHDFRQDFDIVNNNPELAYAYIITNTHLGVPCVYYNHFFGADNIRGEIEALIEATKRYVNGATSKDYLSRHGTPYNSNFVSGFDHTSLIFQMSNSNVNREVVVAINFAGDILQVHHGINMGNLAVGDTLTDIFGISSNDFGIVDGNSELYFEVPPRSFGMWVQGNLVDEQIEIQTYNDTFPPDTGT